jgi:transcriptional regulator with XRE-family HTH domain
VVSYIVHVDTYSSRVAEQVTAKMEAAGLSQLGLSEKTGIARATLIRRLTGRSPFQVDELEAIAGVLGISVGDLLPGEAA